MITIIIDGIAYTFNDALSLKDMLDANCDEVKEVPDPDGVYQEG